MTYLIRLGQAVLLAALCCITSTAVCAQSPEPPQDSAANIERQLARVHAGLAPGNLEPGNKAVPFQATWDSLAAYRTPDWFRDAKFGIFIHWGDRQ